MKTKKVVLAIVFVLMLLAMPIFGYSRQPLNTARKLIIFYSPACHECIKIKNEFMPKIAKAFQGKIQLDYRDISQNENFIFLLGLKEKYQKTLKLEWPVVFWDGKFLSGSQDIKSNLENLITNSLNINYKETGLPAINLLDFFKRFKLFGVIAAGLEDGINPCAFTVIVFFISYLALQGYRKKELIVVGLTFIFAVFLTYFLIGLGIFNSLYALRGFWIITRMVNILIGFLSIILGIFALYDFFKFKKTHQTEGLILQLPKAVKNRIHHLIGLHYRKSKAAKEEVAVVHIFNLTATALITGFLVSLLEAVCTGQLYLPTITLVFKTTPLKPQAIGYLILYNVMFVIPLFIIFLFAFLGVSSEQFSQFLKRHLLTVKILMAVLFFILGIFLIWRA